MREETVISPLIMKDAMIVLTTTSSRQEAENIAEYLVKKRLAACVQIMPKIHSIYVWKKNLCKEREVLLFIKSRRALFKEVEKVIKQHHSYEVPEIMALPIMAGSSSYLQWMKQSLRSK